MQPQQIDITIWALLGQWIIYGSSLAGAIMAISKFISFLRSKTTVAKLEARVNRHDELLNKDNTRLKDLEVQIKHVDADLVDMHKLMQLSIKSNQALLKSQLDGDNKDNIKRISDEIQDYLNSQI